MLGCLDAGCLDGFSEKRKKARTGMHKRRSRTSPAVTALLCRLAVVAVAVMHVNIVSNSSQAHTLSVAACSEGWRMQASAPLCAFLVQQRCLIRRLALRGGVVDGGPELDADGLDTAMQHDHPEGAEEVTYTASEEEDSAAILERGARGGLAAEPSDMETLRKLEKVVRDSVPSPAASSQARSTARSSEGVTGAGALADMMVGGPVDPAEAVAMNQGQSI